MLKYADINPSKTTFIFELDNVLYPEKDYLLQVYYLFANFLEYTESFPVASDLVNFFKNAYEHHGSEKIFERAVEAFGIDRKYEENFLRLHKTAKLPLKLLLFEDVLSLLQSIVVDRKKIFIVTNGDPEQQLNKIRQIEWQGLEQYLILYFADEIKPKPQTDVLEVLFAKHEIKVRDVVIIGASDVDEEFASNSGSDYINVLKVLK